MIFIVDGGTLLIDEDRQDYIGMWSSRESWANKYQHIFQAYTINKLFD